MKFDDNARIQESDVIDMRGQAPQGRRAGGAALRLGGGGLAVTIVVALLSQVLGVDLSGLVGGGTAGGGQPPGMSPASGGLPGQVATPQPDLDPKYTKFIKQTMTDIQDTFEKAFAQQGQQYERAALVLFTQAVDTGCGMSSSEIGPFYCPPDHKAYIDLTFYQDLDKRFGAPGDFAQAYVLAHEIGHHVQNLLQVDRKIAGLRGVSKNAASVMQELQADCYAGVWAASAKARGIVDISDPQEAITAAAAIGDDRLQKQAGMRPNAETFTHGSSAQRVKWFSIGMERADMRACDTFSAPSL